MKRPLRTALWAAAVATAVAVAFPRANTTFNVTAETERVVYVSSSQPRSPWNFYDVRLFVMDDTAGRRFSGTLTFADSVKVAIERLSIGPLRIELEPLNPQGAIGTLQSADGGAPEPIGGLAIMEVDDVEDRARAGHPLVLPLTGYVSTGSVLGFETTPTSPLLRSGKVAMLGRSIFGGTVFRAGSAELDPGDRVVVARPASPAYGFVSVDERPALSVAYRTVARSAQVVRPGGQAYTIGTSFRARLVEDPILQGTWTTLAVLLTLLARVPERKNSRPDSRRRCAARRSPGRRG